MLNTNYIRTIMNHINRITLMIPLIYITINPSNCWFKIQNRPVLQMNFYIPFNGMTDGYVCLLALWVKSKFGHRIPFYSY